MIFFLNVYNGVNQARSLPPLSNRNAWIPSSASQRARKLAVLAEQGSVVFAGMSPTTQSKALDECHSRLFLSPSEGKSSPHSTAPSRPRAFTTHFLYYAFAPIGQSFPAANSNEDYDVTAYYVAKSPPREGRRHSTPLGTNLAW